MQAKENPGRTVWWVLALLVTGGGIGLLAGLSISPVVSIVITSVTGSAAALVAALSGLEGGESANSPAWKIDPVPLGLLVLGLIVGSLGGLYLRTHNALSPDTVTLSAEITQWTDAGLDKDMVVERLFDRQYPRSDGGGASTPAGENPSLSILFAEEAQEECKTLPDLVAKENYDQLRTELLSSSVPPWRELPTIVTDTVTLARIVEKVLCPAAAP